MLNGVMLRGEAWDDSLPPWELPAHRVPSRAPYDLGVLFTFSPISFPNTL